MTGDEAHRLVAALAAGRDRWLTELVPTLRADAVWLVGSLAAGTADEWSDVDLIVVAGERQLGQPLLTLDRPANGPAAGGYTGAMYDVHALPLWVDWYWWPPTAPIPSESHLITGTGTPGNLNLLETLDLIGRGPSGTAPDPDAFALAMLPLAAKHLARGNVDHATAMASMLHAPADLPVGAALSAVLANISTHPPAATAVRHHLDVVKALTAPALWQ